MKARDVMVSPVITVKPSSSVKEVAKIFLERRIRSKSRSAAVSCQLCYLSAGSTGASVLYPIKSRIAGQIQALLLADRRLETARGLHCVVLALIDLER
jgi:CBS domain